MICAWLPLRIVQGLAAIIGWLISKMSTKMEQTTRQNLKLGIPELNQEKLYALVRKSLQHQNKTAM